MLYIQLDTDTYMIKKENVNFHNHFILLYDKKRERQLS